MGHEVVAEVWRGDFLESVHHGTVVATDVSGAPVLSLGRPDDVAFPRSSNKPLQALAMLRSGLDLDGALLALACASHSGEDFHVAGALEILAGAGLSEDALQCTPDLPIGEEARAVLDGGDDAAGGCGVALGEPGVDGGEIGEGPPREADVSHGGGRRTPLLHGRAPGRTARRAGA